MANPIDTFAGKAPDLLTVPATNGETVTKSDTVNLTYVSRGIYVGGTGDVSVLMQDGATLLFSAVPAGTMLPIRCNRINSTSTTATLILSVY